MDLPYPIRVFNPVPLLIWERLLISIAMDGSATDPQILFNVEGQIAVVTGGGTGQSHCAVPANFF